MKFTAVYFRFDNPSESNSEIVIAELNDVGFEGFMETEHGIVGYILSGLLEKIDLNTLYFMNKPEFGAIHIEKEFILEKNWNELWESNYGPVIISDDIIVRAPFHKPNTNYKFEIVIEPKMSFGTGHHETTSLMLQQIYSLDMHNKTVLDVGCGTGILGILASMMGARSVTALDINEWAYENTIENAEKNAVKNMQVFCGGIDLAGDKIFDIVLANITKNVLMDEIPLYSRILDKGGILLISGFLISDLHDIKKRSEPEKLVFEGYVQKKDWIAVKFLKN